MPAVVLYTQERHTAVPPLGSNEPTAAAIAAALRASTAGGQWGNFIGPYPRITRYLSSSIVPGGATYVTRVGWLYGWPDTEYTRANLALLYRNLQQAANTQLQNVSSGFGPITLLAYDPVLSGSIEWWTAPGGAQQTETRDQFPSLFTPVTENPVGPRPAPLLGLPAGANEWWDQWKYWVYAGVALGGVVAIAPYVTPFLARRAAQRNEEW